MAKFPEQLRLSLTWDQGAEMAQHTKLRLDTGLSRHTAQKLDAVAHSLNTRPRKTLGWPPLQKLSTNTWQCSKITLLRRPFESALATAVRMLVQAFWRSPHCYYFLERLKSQLTMSTITDDPIDDTTREQVNDNRKI